MSDKIDFTTFPTTISVDTSNSITVPAGKWLIIHSFVARQTNYASECSLVWNETWDAPAAGSSIWAMERYAASGNFQTTFSTQTTVGIVTATANRTIGFGITQQINCSVTTQSWIAIPLFN